jgi:hypothetical protein
MRKFSPIAVTVAAAVLAIAQLAGPAAAASKKVPDSCALITKADVTTAFAKLEPALQPTSVVDPVRGKPASQGGQGTESCSIAFYLPNSVGGTVLTKTFPVTKPLGCPPKGQPGKTVKIAKTKALLEPNPSHPGVTRDVTFVAKGGCAFIEVFLSGGSSKVPASGFVDLATAALAKKA